MSNENQLNESELSNIKGLITDTQVRPIEGKLSGRDLAQAFIQSRLENANTLESAKSQAVAHLISKIDANTRPELLMKIIEVLDNCTTKDMEHLIALGTNNKNADLLGGGSKVVEDEEVVTPDKSLKMIHNILQAVKVLSKNDSNIQKS